MDVDSLIQHIERDTEATSLPLSVTADWREDGNETTGNQFQQPDWQVRGTQRSVSGLDIVLKCLKRKKACCRLSSCDIMGSGEIN